MSGPARRGRIAVEVLAAVGLAMVAVGVGLLAGTGWAVIAGGVLTVAFALVIVDVPPASTGPTDEEG